MNFVRTIVLRALENLLNKPVNEVGRMITRSSPLSFIHLDHLMVLYSIQRLSLAEAVRRLTIDKEIWIGN